MSTLSVASSGEGSGSREELRLPTKPLAPNEPWPAPESLPQDLPPVQPFRSELLPRVLRAWIEDIAERTQAPADFAAAAAMVEASCLIGRKVRIRPKRKDDWTVTVNLWGAAIGRPGLMKTPLVREVMKPILQLEIDAKKEYAEGRKQYDAKKAIADEQEKLAKRNLKKALEEEDAGLAEEISAGIAGGQPDVPVRRRYQTNDPTVEKLGELLNENPNGLLVLRDELIGWLRSIEKQGQESARAFYLEAWDGSGRFAYDRIGRGTIDIESVCVSIFGNATPGPIGAYVAEAMNGGSGDDGLIQRFQLLVYPDAPKDWVNVDRWPDTQAKQEAREALLRLNTLSPESVGAESDSDRSIWFLRFSEDAQELFDAWRATLEARLRSGADHPSVESALAKYRSLVPSLALITHLLDEGFGPVGRDALDKAIHWAAYLESHMRRALSPAASPSVRATRELGKKILAGDVASPFALKEVYDKGWSGLTDRDVVAAAAEALAELGWLREERDVQTGGRPRVRYRINPALARGGTRKSRKTPIERPSAGFAGSAGSLEEPEAAGRGAEDSLTAAVTAASARSAAEPFTPASPDLHSIHGDAEAVPPGLDIGAQHVVGDCSSAAKDDSRFAELQDEFLLLISRADNGEGRT